MSRLINLSSNEIIVAHRIMGSLAQVNCTYQCQLLMYNGLLFKTNKALKPCIESNYHAKHRHSYLSNNYITIKGQ